MLKTEGDAHSHVRTCQHNCVGGYYGSIDLFFQLRAEDKKKAIIEYLQNLPDSEIRRTILREVQKDLGDIGIKIDESEV